MFMHPYTNPPLSLKFAIFYLHQKPQIEVVICADVSENRLPETKNNFSDYDISQPTPSVSLSVPSCSLAHSCKIKQLDSVGHVHKRMGKHLMNLKSSTKGKLADGKPIGAQGRLTESCVKVIQKYYGYDNT